MRFYIGYSKYSAILKYILIDIPFICLLLYLTFNKATIKTARKGVVIYAKYQTHFRFKKLQ